MLSVWSCIYIRDLKFNMCCFLFQICCYDLLFIRNTFLVIGINKIKKKYIFKVRIYFTI